MWKLKFYHFFGGYGYYVFIASVIMGMLGMMFSIEDLSEFDMFFGTAVGILIPIVVTWLFQNFMPDTLEKVHTAEEPDWRELYPDEYEELLAQQMKKSPAWKLFLYGQIPIGILGVFMLLSGTPLTFFIVELIAAATALTHYVLTWLKAAKWENVDGSARIVEIPIEDTYTVTIHYKRSSETKPYYVFYLPSGKYVVGEDQLYSGHTVKIVRWAGTYIFLK